MKIIPTESINKNTKNIDISSAYEIVQMINNEDKTVAFAIEKALPQISDAVDIISSAFLKGGRLLYFGAGTSGRLGVLDASECPPTFNTDSEHVKGIIAGGERALRYAIEGAEDSEDCAREDFDSLDVTENDVVVSISASGNAKYVVKILELAQKRGCKTVAVTSNPNAKMKEYADCFICAETGAEAISGSTRMKAGTAQKMILNMLTTASMVKIGKTYGNLMIDVRPTNTKLKLRAVSIVSEITACEAETASKVLASNGYDVKSAVLQIKYGLTLEESVNALRKNNGVLRKTFDYLDSKQ